MSFWRKKKPQHPPASSLLDDPVPDPGGSTLRPPAIPTSTSPILIDPSEQQASDPSLPLPNSTSPKSSSPASPARSPSSSRRLSRFNPFRRSSKVMDTTNTAPSSSPAVNNNASPTKPFIPDNIKSPEPPHPDPHSLSPQPRPRTRTPSASPRTSVYGALSSPSSASNPADIFERSIESVPSVSTKSPSVKGVPTHQVLEDIIPPALEATATAFTDHVNPDDVEIVTFCEVQSDGSRSNAGSPIPPASPVLSAPSEATQNPWEASADLHHNGAGSPDFLEGKNKRTLNLMSAVEHLADEIIHPTVPEPVEKKTHVPSPLNLSPAVAPADSAAPRINRNSLADVGVYMERSQSQASTIGDAVVFKQSMGDALRHQRLHGTASHSGDISPKLLSPGVSPPPDPAAQVKRGEELEANPWNQQ